jgi:transposase
MGHCYSLDLRVRMADFVAAGHSCRVAARHFGVSDSCAIKLIQRQRHAGSLTPARQGRPPGRGKPVVYERFLIQTVEARPAVTMPELTARLLEQHEVVAAPGDALALPVPARLHV